MIDNQSVINYILLIHKIIKPENFHLLHFGKFPMLITFIKTNGNISP